MYFHTLILSSILEICINTCKIYTNNFGFQVGDYSLSVRSEDFVISSTGLQAVPKYWTSQGKVTYDLSSTQKFYINFVNSLYMKVN